VAEVGVYGENLRAWVGSMLEDFRILEHHPRWADAVYAVLDFAERTSVTALLSAGKDAAATTINPLAAEMLKQLHRAEPGITPCAGAVCMLSDQAPGSLFVIAASEAATAQSARSKVGAVWKKNSPNVLSVEAFTVLRSGKAVLRSPHGTDANAVSIAPLKERCGRTFGTLISGAPALPDELIRLMAIAVGPVLERIWKWNKVNAMLKVACTWLSSISPKLSNAKWLTGKSGQRPNKRAWQPLFYTSGEGMRTFELELRWTKATLAATLGTLTVTIPVDEDLSVDSLELLQATGTMLQEAVEEIERMPVGDAVPLSSHSEYSSSYNASRLLLPERLQTQMRSKLCELRTETVFAELRSYAPGRSADFTKVMAGVLALLGVERKSLKSWNDVRLRLNRDLVHEILEFDCMDQSPETLGERWAESVRASKGIDIDDLLTTAPYPIQAMARWMMAMRLVMQVVITIDAEAHPPDRPAADTTGEAAAPIAEEPTPLERGESLQELLQGAGEV